LKANEKQTLRWVDQDINSPFPDNFVSFNKGKAKTGVGRITLNGQAIIGTASDIQNTFKFANPACGSSTANVFQILVCDPQPQYPCGEY
jgi:hypothetical protein